MPRGLNEACVQRLLTETEGERVVAKRVEVFSRHFVGRPYRSNSLVGSVDTMEVFTASLDGFDCVTYLETVLALAHARTPAGFVERLRNIRYEKGRVEWKHRNHYMTSWIRNNERAGLLAPVSIPGPPAVVRERVLSVVAGLAAQHARLKCIPKRALARAEAYLESGDLIFFVSTRINLDVFHAGIIVRDGIRTLIRHASRSRGAVVEQDLAEFLNDNRMAGVIVARPRGQARVQ